MTTSLHARSLRAALVALAPAVLYSAPAAAQDGAFIEETAGLPMVHATLAPDGRYTLLIRADTAWEEAELTVRGDGAMDLGAASVGAPVRVEGWTTSRGSLSLSLAAVTPSARGVQWNFTVEPELVPAATPPPQASDPEARAPRLRLFDRNR